jgi:hypothetical protein
MRRRWTNGCQAGREQRTVNPLTGPRRYNFLNPSSRPALRPGNDTTVAVNPAHPAASCIPRRGGDLRRVWADGNLPGRPDANELRDNYRCAPMSAGRLARSSDVARQGLV